MERMLEDKLLQSDERQDLKGRIWIESKKLWTVAGPSILTRISSFGILVVTQAFMGHIGETELSSYALVLTLITRFANGIMLGMACALETLCGQAFGAKQYHMMGIYLQRSWIILTIAAIIILPLYIWAAPILRLVGESDELSEMAGQIALWFIPIVFYFMFSATLQFYLQAQLKNSIIAWLSSASFMIHVALSWIFVIKLGWGIPGAMGSMIVACWVSIIGEFIYVFGGWCPLTWRGFSKSAFSELWSMAWLSVSSGVMMCLELWYNAVLILLAGYMKNATVAIAAFSICLNITVWILMIGIGFLSATCVRVGNELGRRDAKAAKFAIKVALSTSSAIGLAFFILILGLRNVLSYAFTSSIQVAKMVSELSVLLAFSVLLNSIQPIFTGVAIGAGWQSVVAYVNIGCYYVIGVPLGILLGCVAHLQIQGIWIGMICGIAAQTLVLVFMTGKTDWDLQVEKATARLEGWFVPDESKDVDDVTSIA
ncbi:protein DETOXIFICATION 20-like [Magnolia sinica]|uniref:protein DETOXIFICATION 20-like n=1 Tax=Magnolia sinica TaxID=86752 RepID=UPI00265AEA3F|nr:protein DETOXIFICATION 20-like [Magnolia sinica]XP_058078286.1 protein DETOXIFICATION 20-like [Magnolia sinica]